jgi:hypothetical protein
MNLLPSDDVPRFQLLSVLFLVSILSSVLISDAAFALSFIVFWAMCILLAGGLRPTQQAPAYLLFGAFSLFGIAALIMRNYAKTPPELLFALPVMAIGFFLLYVIFKAFLVPDRVECKVIGYSDGYAVIETYPAILSVLPPGTYAVRSGPVKKGKAGFAVVGRKIFGSAQKPRRLAF